MATDEGGRYKAQAVFGGEDYRDAAGGEREALTQGGEGGEICCNLVQDMELSQVDLNF